MHPWTELRSQSEIWTDNEGLDDDEDGLEGWESNRRNSKLQSGVIFNYNFCNFTEAACSEENDDTAATKEEIRFWSQTQVERLEP